MNTKPAAACHGRLNRHRRRLRRPVGTRSCAYYALKLVIVAALGGSKICRAYPSEVRRRDARKGATQVKGRMKNTSCLW